MLFFSLLFLLIIPFFYDKRYDEVRSTRAITLSNNFCLSFTRSTESLERHAIQLPLHTSNEPTHTPAPTSQLFSSMRTCRQRTRQELMKELFRRPTCILLPYFFTQWCISSRKELCCMYASLERTTWSREIQGVYFQAVALVECSVSLGINLVKQMRKMALQLSFSLNPPESLMTSFSIFFRVRFFPSCIHAWDSFQESGENVFL